MAKKSRRTRREETQKQGKAAVAAPPVTIEKTAELPVKATATTPRVEATPENQRKTLDFVQEYAHVYYDVRSVVIISVLMFMVMVALSFAI